MNNEMRRPPRRKPRPKNGKVVNIPKPIADPPQTTREALAWLIPLSWKKT